MIIFICSTLLLKSGIPSFCLKDKANGTMIFYHPSSASRPQYRVSRLTSDIFKTDLGDHDFCLSWSHYIDTDPTSRVRTPREGIVPMNSWQGVASSTD